MPCCGLVAFLLAQPLLLWKVGRAWIKGEVRSSQALQMLSTHLVARVVAAELVMIVFGMALTIAAWQPVSSVAHTRLAPLGIICTVVN